MSWSTCSGDAPFCGPKTAGASRGEVVTSRTSVHRARRARGSRPARSRRAASASVAPPRGSSRPSAPRMRAPSAVISPAPPSVVAEPPRHKLTSSAPAARQSRITSPVPNVDAPEASGESATAGSPDADARSSTARPGAGSHQRAVIGRPMASTVATSRAMATSWAVAPVPSMPTGPVPSAVPAHACASNSAVPSPPSAMGTAIARAPASRAPAAIASAASRAVAVPLKLSGQQMTVNSACASMRPSWRGAVE